MCATLDQSAELGAIPLHHGNATPFSFLGGEWSCRPLIQNAFFVWGGTQVHGYSRSRIIHLGGD